MQTSVTPRSYAKLNALLFAAPIERGFCLFFTVCLTFNHSARVFCNNTSDTDRDGGGKLVTPFPFESIDDVA